jgi:hypothetical protein
VSDPQPSTGSPMLARGAGPGSVIATVALMVVSVVLSGMLFFGSLIWAMDSQPNRLGFGLAVYAPLLITLAGIVVGIVLMVKRRPAYLAPLLAIVISLLCWWMGGLIVAS